MGGEGGGGWWWWWSCGMVGGAVLVAGIINSFV